jgi:nucleoid DNA-binding protein
MGKLTIQEIAAVLTEKNGFEKSEANKFVSAMFALIQERLETDQLAKIKGLGTFKIIDVEARESISVRTGERVTISGHSKVSFTPDAMMKELVNKPFSQFETVVLNDGVEFDDIKDEGPEEEESVEDAPLETTPVQPLIEIVEEESIPQETEASSLELAEKPMPEVVEEAMAQDAETPAPMEAEKPEPQEAADVQSHIVEDSVARQVDEPVASTHLMGHWVLYAVLSLFLMAVSGLAGYYYGSYKTLISASKPDTVVVHDTVTAVPVDTVPTQQAPAEQPDIKPEPQKPAAEVPRVEPVQAPAKFQQTVVQASAKVEKKDAKPAEDFDKYAEKDSRVRLGAYRIVGLSHEVKVQKGQTFYSICRANLGPDMECYVEVYNNLSQNPKLKEGQVIKIPKLQLKTRRR